MIFILFLSFFVLIFFWSRNENKTSFSEFIQIEKNIYAKKKFPTQVKKVVSHSRELRSLKLPLHLKYKVLPSDDDKNEIKKHYTDPVNVNYAINFLLNINLEPKGENGITRIDSIDFLEKSIRYRNNIHRAKIIQFIEDFIHKAPPEIFHDQQKKFFIGDQIELLEILAFNQPREFQYLKERTSSKKVLKMMKLVEHHANQNH